MAGNMDSELLLKFIGISQTTFQHCRVRFYGFFGQPLSKQLYTNIPQEEGVQTVCRAYDAFYENKPPIHTPLLKEALIL